MFRTQFAGIFVLGQDEVDPAFVHDEADAFGRERGLDRYVGGAGLEDGEERGDHLHAVVHHHPDASGVCREGGGDAGRQSIQLTECHRAAVVDDSYRIGLLLNLGLKIRIECFHT